MILTADQVLIANGYLSVGGLIPDDGNATQFPALMSLATNQPVLTVINNLSYYGYMPSISAAHQMLMLSQEELASFWQRTESALKELTADNRRMDDFVVYQNFPKEVLDMTRCEYWGRQILLYWGLDKELLTQEKTERPPLTELKSLKVLHSPEDGDALPGIWESLLRSKTRWSAPQQEHAKFLLTHLRLAALDVDTIAFKENAIQLVSHLFDAQVEASVAISTATDVLRLAALRSDGDVALRQPVKFKSFSRAERRFLCQLLENTKHLEDDFAERPALFKHLLQRLHPGDFRSGGRLNDAYSALYQGQLRSFASRVEAGIASADVEVLKTLQRRPGDFARRLHKTYEIFGQTAITSFVQVMDKLTTHQLVKLIRYVETANDRKTFVAPPKGNWNKLQVIENTKQPFSEDAIGVIRNTATALVRDRLTKLMPGGVDLDAKTSWIKLQTNDQELANYGRGTIFQIPDNVNFLRTASYWENDPKQGYTWFDNGWNFFDDNWQDVGSICWNNGSFGHDEHGRKVRRKKGAAAIFSGDPVNITELKGRACQMIDLYLDRLQDAGVRYAVWNILCYSQKAFSEATGEVVASLQWGEKAEEGKLYEPSRAQMVFPLTGNSKTKYIAYIDVEKRQLIYIDANLKGKVHSASSNGAILAKQMPAFLEYLNALPSVADLFGHAEKGSTPAVYSDKDRELHDNKPAYVFLKENQNSQFQPIDLAKLL